MGEDFSAPTEWQRDLMQRMTALDVKDASLLRGQAKKARVRVVDSDGSFKVRTEGERWWGDRRVPIEASTLDKDGIPIEILMHVIDGYIAEIEILKVDGSCPPFEFPLVNLIVREGRQGRW